VIEFERFGRLAIGISVDTRRTVQKYTAIPA
jgi:hypothetical protein